MTRVVAVDVHYGDAQGARAAAVVAGDARMEHLVAERVVRLPDALPYEPGRLFLRELPAIEAVVAGMDGVDLLVVDAYVDLDAEGTPGLGARVHERLGVPVLGVAKTWYRTASHAAQVRRGTSRRPLYVTTAGIPLAEGARLVADMAGPHRLPTALQRVDALARGAAPRR